MEKDSIENKFIEVLVSTLNSFENLYFDITDWENKNPLEKVTQNVFLKIKEQLEIPFLALSIYSVLYQKTLSFEEGIFKEKNKEYLAKKIKETINTLQNNQSTTTT